VVQSNPSPTFSSSSKLQISKNLLASRLKIPWRPIKPRPLDLQGPIFVSSSPSQAPVMQQRLDGAVSEKNTFPVHDLRSDYHKSIICASSATRSSRVPSFLKRAHMLPRDLGVFFPRIPPRKKRRSLCLRRYSPFQEILGSLHSCRFQSATLAAPHALIRRIANITKAGIPSTSTPANPRSRQGLVPTFNNPLAANWYTLLILNVKYGSHKSQRKTENRMIGISSLVFMWDAFVNSIHQVTISLLVIWWTVVEPGDWPNSIAYARRAFSHLLRVLVSNGGEKRPGSTESWATGSREDRGLREAG
jgi:hypothetical protein